jgi:histidinol-phosphate aminotransferase
LPLRPRRNIAGLGQCHHGGIDPAELASRGIDPDAIIDFSISTNPFMPPPGIREELSGLSFGQYPDSTATALRRALASRLSVTPDNILVGSGTTELIRLIALTYLRRGDSALIIEPTYGEYEVAARFAGARLRRYRAQEKDGFRPDISEVTGLIRNCRPRLGFVCNPNNPTGVYLPRDDIETLLAAMPEGLLVLDEAYVAFVADAGDSTGLIERDNIVLLRSMTKDYGMPGLRLGYAVAHGAIIEALRRVMPPWSVNSVALTVGAAVLPRDEYFRQSLRQVRRAKDSLVEDLTGLGLEVLPSAANYFLIKVGDGAAFRSALLGKGIQVRDCASFGLPEYIRIAPRTPPENEKLVAAVAAILPSGGDNG